MGSGEKLNDLPFQLVTLNGIDGRKLLGECYLGIVLPRRTCWWSSLKTSKLVMKKIKFSKEKFCLWGEKCRWNKCVPVVRLGKNEKKSNIFLVWKGEKVFQSKKYESDFVPNNNNHRNYCSKGIINILNWWWW